MSTSSTSAASIRPAVAPPIVDNNGVTQPVNPAGGDSSLPSDQTAASPSWAGSDYQAVRGDPALRADGQLRLHADRRLHRRRPHGGRPGARRDRGSINNPNINTPPALPLRRPLHLRKVLQLPGRRQAYGGAFVPRIPGDPFQRRRHDHAGVTATTGPNTAAGASRARATSNCRDTLKLTSITGYREFDTQFFADGDLSPARTGFGINNLSNWSFSQELRLNCRITDTIFRLSAATTSSSRRFTIRCRTCATCRPTRCSSASPTHQGRRQGGLRQRGLGNRPRPEHQRRDPLHQGKQGPELFPVQSGRDDQRLPRPGRRVTVGLRWPRHRDYNHDGNTTEGSAR